MNADRHDEADPRDEERQGPKVRDKRRIDPKTGEVREPAQKPAPAASESAVEPDADGEPDEEKADLKKRITEHKLDLQRLQAEYANYRKRVERDRVAVREQALANVLGELLPVLDDIDRARDHGEFAGGFKQVGEALETTLGKLGLERFGEKGAVFDPTVHEALMHSYSTEVTEPTAVEILQAGYTVGGRVLRPARVAVAEPEEETADEPASDEAPPEGETPTGEATADSADEE